MEQIQLYAGLDVHIDSITGTIKDEINRFFVEIRPKYQNHNKRYRDFKI